MLIEKGANEGAVDETWNMTPLHYLAILDSSKSAKPEYSDWTDDDTLSNLNFTSVFSTRVLIKIISYIRNRPTNDKSWC